jgi:uncharacterized protein (DUF1330 family)
MDYLRFVRETVEAYGGKTWLADHEHQALEGQPEQIIE